MVKNEVSHLNKISKILNVTTGKVYPDEEGVPCRVLNNAKVTGFLNIVLQYLKEAKSSLAGANNLEKAEIRQWIEYAIVYAEHNENSTNINHVLTELNGILALKTYLVANKLTIADIVLYYIVQNIMEDITHMEKEKFINVSRWFDNIQQNPSIRQQNQIIDFNTNYLVALVPARH